MAETHLVLSRKESEGIVVDGPAVIRIHEIRGNRVQVGVTANRSVRVVREELRKQPEGATDGEVSV